MTNPAEAKTPAEKLAAARRVADTIRVVAPDQAAAIDAAIAEFTAGKRDGVSVNVGIAFKLEKFHAVGFVPGVSQPFEVIEGTDNI
jgi:hypothetical protein